MAFSFERLLLAFLILVITVSAAFVLLGFTSLPLYLELEDVLFYRFFLSSLPLMQLDWIAQVGLCLGVVVLWWLGFAFLSLKLMRGVAFELAKAKPLPKGSAYHYAKGYVFSLFLTPFLLLFVLSPLLLLILGWSGLTQVSGFGFYLSALILPLVLLAGVLVAGMVLVSLLSLPVLVPSFAFHGGGVYQGFSRGVSYVILAPLKTFALLMQKLFANLLALLGTCFLLFLSLCLLCTLYGVLVESQAGYALFELLVGLRSPDQLEPWMNRSEATALLSGFLFGVSIALAYPIVCGAISDVIFFILLRHACDGVPVQEILIPEEDVQFKLTSVERQQALKVLGLLEDAAASQPSKQKDA